jgi:hypothetical protein
MCVDAKAKEICQSAVSIVNQGWMPRSITTTYHQPGQIVLAGIHLTMASALILRGN